SGNQGITSTVPLYIYASNSGISEKELYRSIVASWMTTIYATAFTKYISPLCSVGIKGGAGLASGFAYLMQGNEKAAELSAINQTASLAGMVCDGAKPGCALKVASGVETAYRSAFLAKNGLRPSQLEGITGESLEETLININEYINSVSSYANRIISNIISAKLNKSAQNFG
ncbi:MAG: L-serine ammonia-lyase, iron-sulfur-dependent, subunit alpha, partial [Nitrososphaeria archaeon]